MASVITQFFNELSALNDWNVLALASTISAAYLYSMTGLLNLFNPKNTAPTEIGVWFGYHLLLPPAMFWLAYYWLPISWDRGLCG